MSSEQTVKMVVAALATLLSPMSPAAVSARIVAADQSFRGLLFIDEDGPRSRIVGKWDPAADPSLTFEQVEAMRSISECKPLDGGRSVLVCASCGGVAEVDVATMRAKWFSKCPQNGSGPHSVAKLPDGRVAVANAERENMLELTDHLAAPFNPEKQKFVNALPVFAAHGVVWDDVRSSLFVLGFTNLYELTYCSDTMSVKERRRWNFALECEDERGHDLVLCGDGTFRFSNKGGVWKFNPSGNPRFEKIITASSVKSYSPSARGDLLAIPREKWWTDRLTVYRNGKVDRTVGPFPGARFYKARWLDGGVDWEAVNAQARAEANVPIRVGVPGKRPFWNLKSRAFMRPPAFDFKKVEGACSYRFTVEAKKGGASFVFEGDRPTASLAPVWGSVPAGYVRVTCEGLSADKRILGVAGTRECYRAAVFKGPYPSGKGDYRTAARRVYAAVYAMPHVQGWLTSDVPPEGYDLYCYPATVLSSMIRALCHHAKDNPTDAVRSLTISRKMADWMIAQSQGPTAPLAHCPPTYWGDRREVAVKYRGQSMLTYPCHAADAYFDLAEATGEAKYLDAALAIARTLTKIQGADGTWPLKVYEKDGRPVRANRLVPDRYVFRMLDRAFAKTRDAAFKAAADKAFECVLTGPCETWEWDGQFEDVDPLPPYHNLQKDAPIDTANRLFANGGSVTLACELVDWSEDQFVVWSDPIHHMDWQNWKLPTVLEQYEYYTPIDASMGDMIDAFASAYKATGNALYLEKAKALADNITRYQRADGTIPTYFDTRKGSDWVNCMIYVADCLEKLASVCQEQ